MDLQLAIQQYQEALEATPPDHPERAERLQDLGTGYHDRYLRTGAEMDLQLAIQQYETAVHYSSSRIPDRLKPGTYLISLHVEAENWSLAYQTASTVMSLIVQLTPRSLDTSDKQHLLTQVSGLASDAAAIALMAEKKPYEALRLLELGRGVIIGSINEMRADISDLLQQHPQLAEEYIKLRNELNAPIHLVVQSGMPILVARQVNQRRDAAQKLERTIQAIRSLPSFDRFLMAPSEEEIKAAAVSGPIVIINASIYRCDALIVDKLELKSLPLPGLKHSDIQVQSAALLNPGALDTRLLEWLWDTIAKPILDTLGLTQKPDGYSPRIWWIPTGPLSRFPIHAAGYHFRDSHTVLDRVISSYSSSVRALLQSHYNRSTPKAERGFEKAVLVGMEKTPGLMDLPSVPLEMERLEQLCSFFQIEACKPHSCLEDVLSALNDCDIFHFAGHGETDPTDPQKSSLVLRSGRLAIADLFETNLRNHKPFLAYLSACGTGQVKHEGLVDEALHLIAAYQIVGFQHVIGTLWEVNDMTCVEAATIIYSFLQEKNMTDDSVSEGLHRASMKLRESWISDNITRAANRKAFLQGKDVPIMTKQTHSCQSDVRDSRAAQLIEDTPLYWVPFVHFGI
jgi:hypothetical protein